jgi:hypothetical protein
MKIEITLNSNKYVIERETFDVETAFDDFLNLLFIAGVDIQELEKIIAITPYKAKKNHKKYESKKLPNTCNL